MFKPHAKAGCRSYNRTCVAMVAAAAFFAGAPVAADELTFVLRDGRVTIVAVNVTLDQILTEWTRVGLTEFVGAEPLNDLSMTLRLVDVSETEALRVLLRSASGHASRYRSIVVPGVSRFDRVLILATSEPTVSPSASRPAVQESSSGTAWPALSELTRTLASDKREPKPLETDPQGIIGDVGVQGAPDPQGGNRPPVPRFAPLTPVERAGQRLNRSLLQQSLFFGAEPTRPDSTFRSAPLLQQSAPRPGIVAAPVQPLNRPAVRLPQERRQSPQ